MALLLLPLGACRTPPANDASPPLAIGATVSPSTPDPDVPAESPAAIAVGGDAAPEDAHLARLFAEARALVEADSGTDLSDVRLHLADDAALIGEVALETRRLVHGRLGESPLAGRLLDALVDGQAGTYAALYAGRQRTVMVSREVLGGYLASLPPGRQRRDDALLVLMLHELVHAADDLRYGIHANRTLDFRASFAQSAAFEGHAQWRTRRICRVHGCLGGLASLDAFMFGERPEGGPELRGAVDGTGGRASRTLPVDRNLLEYSYVEGERFVEALAAREGGDSLIERLLSAPPHDPLQILDPASFPNEAREARNREMLAAALGVAHPWFGAAAASDVPTRRVGASGGASGGAGREVRDGGGGGLRIAVETSPLKGVNLRRDPERRRAAIDGFTRLVTAMVAVQLHDPSADELSPVEVTLMRTDQAATARLFANTLHAHALVPGARASTLEGTSGDGAGGEALEATDGGARDSVRDGVRRLSRTATTLPDGGTWRTSIATDGVFVVQASGRDAAAVLMDDYVLGVLDALLAAPRV